MSRPTLATERIRLAPMTTEHLPHLVELDSDPEVLKFILGRARSQQEVHDYWGPICARSDADAVGLGWWVGFRHEDDDFLGWWDLSPDLPVSEKPTRAQAGWRLARRHWREGYATEGAAALLQHGFGALPLSIVWAETMAVNRSSRAVMAKLGMRHVRTDHRSGDNPRPGAEHGEVFYEITRREWCSRSSDPT